MDRLQVSFTQINDSVVSLKIYKSGMFTIITCECFVNKEDYGDSSHSYRENIVTLPLCESRTVGFIEKKIGLYVKL